MVIEDSQADRRTPVGKSWSIRFFAANGAEKSPHEKDGQGPIRKLMSVNELTMSRGRVIAGIIPRLASDVICPAGI